MTATRSKWNEPGIILGIVGMIAATGTAYATLNGRIVAIEHDQQGLSDRVTRMEERIEKKLDKLITKEATK